MGALPNSPPGCNLRGRGRFWRSSRIYPGIKFGGGGGGGGALYFPSLHQNSQVPINNLKLFTSMPVRHKNT